MIRTKDLHPCKETICPYRIHYRDWIILPLEDFLKKVEEGKVDNDFTKNRNDKGLRDEIDEEKGKQLESHHNIRYLIIDTICNTPIISGKSIENKI
jgi:hypothetical protein